MQHWTAAERSQVIIHAMTQMNLKIVMLSERHWVQEMVSCVISLIQTSRTDKMQRQSQICGCQRPGGQEEGIESKRAQGSFWGWGNCSIYWLWRLWYDPTQLPEFIKLYACNSWILLHVSNTLINGNSKRKKNSWLGRMALTFPAMRQKPSEGELGSCRKTSGPHTIGKSALRVWTCRDWM